jgi:hypothetical protein
MDRTPYDDLADRVSRLEQEPFRMADDWETDNIVEPTLARRLKWEDHRG